MTRIQNLYNIKSNDFNGHPLLKGIDDENGIAIFDLSTNITQWFVSNSDDVLNVTVTNDEDQTQTRGTSSR